MNKTQFIDAVAVATESKKSQTAKIVDGVLQEITKALSEGERVQLIGFGTFEPKQRAERQGKNPRTGESLTIPEATVVTFKAGQALKDSVNK